jgi:hypothetical protein
VRNRQESAYLLSGEHLTLAGVVDRGRLGECDHVPHDVAAPGAPLEERTERGACVPAALLGEPLSDQRVVQPLVVALGEPLDPDVPDHREDPRGPHDALDGAAVRGKVLPGRRPLGVALAHRHLARVDVGTTGAVDLE